MRTARVALATTVALVGCTSPEPRPVAQKPTSVAEKPTPQPDRKSHAGSPRVLACLPREAQDFLRDAESFEVLRVTPGKTAPEDLGLLGAMPILKTVAITDAAERARILDKLYESIDEGSGPEPLSFSPHHGIRAITGARRLEIIISFSFKKLETDARGVAAASSVTISRAAEETLARFVGRDPDPYVGGRSAEEWGVYIADRMRKAEDEKRELELGPEDEAGLVVIADAMAWDPNSSCASLLLDLGPRAAPASAALARILDVKDKPYAGLMALQIIKAIGPNAASTRPAIERLLANGPNPLLNDESQGEAKALCEEILAGFGK